VLLVACDVASHALDPADPDTYGLFGDGAAAAVLDAGDGRTGLRALRLETWSEQVEACCIAGGGSRLPPTPGDADYWQACRFRMDGRRLYRTTATHFDRFVGELLDEAGLGLDAIDRVIPHQASKLGMQHVFKSLGVGAERVEDILASHGNQVAASLPTALHLALASGRLQRDQRALLLGTAAGLTLGGAVLQL
jgi:3-oxoacyl-[acyl-carrier-protein] synthase-3